MSEQDHLTALLATLDQADAQIDQLITDVSLPMQPAKYRVLRRIRLDIGFQRDMARDIMQVQDEVVQP